MPIEYPELPRYEIEAHGIRTAYYVAGPENGRPVILLHGMTTSGDSFRELMTDLSDTFHLIAPDFPGFGFSAHTSPYTIPHLVEWLADFLDTLHLDRVNILGHSFGGVVATHFTLSYPEQVARLTLMAPAILRAEMYPDALKKVGFSLKLVDLGSAISQSNIWVKRQNKVPFFAPEKQPDSVWERRLADYDRSRASADVLKAVAFQKVKDQLHRIQHPVALIWGLNDPVVPVKDADAIARLMPIARIDRLPECGHIPMLEQPLAVQKVLREFFHDK